VIKVLFLGLLSIKLLLIIGFYSTPFSVEASIFSFVSNLFASNDEESSAKKANSQTIALLEAPLNPNTSIGGGDITIVDDDALVSEGGPYGDKEHSSGRISIYVVKDGDTLGAIAKMFHVSSNTILWANDIKGRPISPGETLVILPVTGVKHIVKKGDTLRSIANQYKADLDDILQFNNLGEGITLAIGDVVIIPDGEVSSSQGAISKKFDNAPTSKPRNSTGQPNYQGYFLRPILGGVRTQGIHGYNAVDLADAIGTSIMAAADGTVIVSKSSGWNGGYGEYVVISHSNGTQTLYAHMSKVLVSIGQRVSQGQQIGLMGRTGKATGSHVHFEVRGAVNPFGKN
jgi:LysM repeat protein